jgi:glycerol-3-phosphate dehydrogenase
MTVSVRTAVEDLAGREFDLLVIGGGITGAGILRDAAMRGLRAALVDQGDFGAGTSSRSSRLIHGGLRYLEHGQMRLVFEALRERAILLRIAPHLVHPLPFAFPLHKGDRVARWKLALGLGLYGVLAAGGNVPRPRIFGKAGMLALEPNLRVKGLVGGGLYYDAQCDDARLTVATVRSAVGHGAVACSYARVDSLIIEDGRVVGARLTEGRKDGTTERTATEGRNDGMTDGTARPGDVPSPSVVPSVRLSVHAKVVVNATGPWTDSLRIMEDSNAAPLLRLTSGAHVVVRRSRLGHTRAITCLSPIDGRVMFILPWGDLSYVGTTDTDYSGDPAAVHATPEDITYLLRSANSVFPHARLEAGDVISSWAGVRALLDGHGDKPASSVSREHRILTGPGGMITVAGGKLTTYRKMAAEVVDLVEESRRQSKAVEAGPTSTDFDPLRPSSTDTEPLPGGESATFDPFRATGTELGLSPATIEHLIRTFGTETAAVYNLVRGDRRLREPVHPEHPAIAAEVVQIIRREMVTTAEDILARRLRLTSETSDGGAGAIERVKYLMRSSTGA